MKKKLLTTVRIREPLSSKLEELGYDITYVKDKDIVFLPEYKDIDVLIMRFPHRLPIDQMENLEYIQLSSTGIPTELAKVLGDRDITVCNNPSGYNIPIGEFIVTKVLDIYKNTRNLERLQKEKLWQIDYEIDELTGKKALFIGAGNIAQEGAKRLIPFGVECIGVNTDGRDVQPFLSCIPIKDLISSVGDFDIYVNTLPFTESTHHLLNESFFANAKENSVFVNVSRGEVVDEKIMIQYAHKFKGIALDVFEKEPLPQESPLWEMENVYISSHTSWASPFSAERFMSVVQENLTSWIKDKKVKYKVDVSRGY